VKALRVEERATSEGMQMPLETKKDKDMDCPLDTRRNETLMSELRTDRILVSLF